MQLAVQAAHRLSHDGAHMGAVMHRIAFAAGGTWTLTPGIKKAGAEAQAPA